MEREKEKQKEGERNEASGIYGRIFFSTSFFTCWSRTFKPNSNIYLHEAAEKIKKRNTAVFTPPAAAEEGGEDGRETRNVG